LELSLEVCVVWVVVVCVVVELVLGVAGFWLGEVDAGAELVPGVVDCGVPGVV
jgi:hypothetical protein